MAQRAKKFAGRFSRGTWLYAGTSSRRKRNRFSRFIRLNAARPCRSREAQSYDDWCTGANRATLGNDADYQFFLKRAADYKNVFGGTKAMSGRKMPMAIGSNLLTPGFSGGQGGRDYTTENNGYTYDWDVQHDLQGLFELMGGRTNARSETGSAFPRTAGHEQI